MTHRIFSIAIAVVAASTLSAQIPNAGFENWTTVGSYMNPDGWGTMNNATASFSVFTATKATPGSPGAAYIKLTSKTTGTTVTNGIAVSGRLDTLTLLPKSGFAYNLRPANFTGKWQHMIFGSSQGAVKVITTRWNATTSRRDTVAHAEQTLAGMAMSWANFSLPLVYVDSLNYPDSCTIVLQASGSNPTNNDYLWVDNLAFTGTVAVASPSTTVGTAETKAAITSVVLFPNPAHESIQLNISLHYPQPVQVEVFDMSGKRLYAVQKERAVGVQTERLDVRHFPKGTYLLKVSGQEGSETKKFIVE